MNATTRLSPVKILNPSWDEWGSIAGMLDRADTPAEFRAELEDYHRARRAAYSNALRRERRAIRSRRITDWMELSGALAACSLGIAGYALTALAAGTLLGF